MLVPARTRSRRSRTDWERLLSDHSQSGSSVQSFCKARGITPSNFYYWQKRLRQPPGDGDRHSTTASLLALPLISADYRDTVWRVELELGAGVVLRIK